MERRSSSTKPIVYALVIFLLLGVSIANAMLTQLGLQDNYVLMFSIAFVVAGLTLSRNIFLLLAVLLGVLAFNQPDEWLARFYLDKDLLLAAIIALIMVPSAYRALAH